MTYSLSFQLHHTYDHLLSTNLVVYLPFREELGPNIGQGKTHTNTEFEAGSVSPGLVSPCDDICVLSELPLTYDHILRTRLVVYLPCLKELGPNPGSGHTPARELARCPGLASPSADFWSSLLASSHL